MIKQDYKEVKHNPIGLVFNLEIGLFTVFGLGMTIGSVFFMGSSI